MGCFFTCFGGSKNHKTGRNSNRSLPIDSENEINSSVHLIPFPKEIFSLAAHESVSELRKNEKAAANVKKRVTFDLNVTTFENATVPEDPKNLESTETEIQARQENNGTEKHGKDKPKPAAFPPNYRYQNCESSDDDKEEDSDKEDEEDYQEYDLSEEEYEITINENEESYGSYFSLPMENEWKIFKEVGQSNPATDSATAKEQSIVAKSYVRDRSQYIHTVWNPVENLTQWKRVKFHTAALKNSNKENIYSEMKDKTSVSPESTLKIHKPKKSISSSPNARREANQEIALDTSLSNWLFPLNDPRLGEPEKANSTLSSSPSL